MCVSACVLSVFMLYAHTVPLTCTHQEIQFVFHVLEQSTNHGSQMNDVCWFVLLKQYPSTCHVTVWVHTNGSINIQLL